MEQIIYNSQHRRLRANQHIRELAAKISLNYKEFIQPLFIVNAIHQIKKTFGSTIWIAADVCLCAYTTHRHCGILNAAKNKVLNNESLMN